MDVKLGIYIFIVLECISLGFFAEGRRPKLYIGTQYTEAEYIIHSNDDFSIVCIGTEPVTWTYPNNNILGTSFSSFRVKDDLINDKEYKSSLTISNASFVDAGFYYCHGVHASTSDESRSTSLYIYVEDEEHLTVITAEVETINEVHQYSDVVIPCRPTSPDISVKLYKSADDSEINAEYNPKLGFIYTPLHIASLEELSCIFTKGNKTTTHNLYLRVEPRTTSIAKPYIEDLNVGHTVVGQTLTLKCTLRCFVQFYMNWTIPDATQKHPGRVTISPVTSTNHTIHHGFIHIKNVTKADQGNYSCLVKDHKYENNNTIFIKIYDAEEHFIRLFEENEVYNISIRAGEPFIQWRIDIDAHPLDNLTAHWFDNNNELVAGTDSKMGKYEVKESPTEAFLRINSININDHGNYTLVVKNKYEEKQLQLSLNVTDKPSVHIETSDFHYINSNSTIKCIAAGYPEPKIYWKFKPCLDRSCEYENISEYYLQRNGLQMISYISLLSTATGELYCYAVNSLGNDSDTKPFYITDVKHGFDIWFSENIIEEPLSIQKKVAIGDKLELYCGASVYQYINDINWYNNNIKIENDNDHIIERSHTQYSNKVALIIRNATKTNSGTYFCNVTSMNSTFNETQISLLVLEPQLPEIYETNMQDSFAMELPDALHINCFISGIPKPNLYWFKNGVPIYADNRTVFVNNSQILQFRKTIDTDEGTYVCKASNKVGDVQRSMGLTFNNKQSVAVTYGVIITLLVVLSLCLIVLIWRIRKEAILRRELKAAGLANFEKGEVDSLNPDLGIDDQAELLPYDKKWEFPRQKIKLGKQLGSGAFGVVVKAEAAGILGGEEPTTVAVKMVKRNADHALIKALASELKIMVHLGKHINVVNLLGACTKNVAKRELLVIVEYCRFGNLQNYLLRHRDNFIDQIDMNTGKINYSIGSDVLDRSFSFSSSRSNSHSSKSPTLKYISLKFAQNSEEGGHINKLMADYRTNPTVNYCTNTDTTTVLMTPTGDSDDVLMSNNSSSQPEWRSNYRGDYKGNVRPICTKDLLAWSFQVARAMEYLASRKVLHGDLAARNILLADDNIVKICDFGLAKSMYKSGNYKKKGDGPVPVKWMSIEAIRDRIFSTQSDVWSFGIVLWEFFSLGRTPYPGMEADERLYNKLKDGFRMDAPTYATKEIHDMMLNCWEAKPINRPTFLQLADKIGILLEESVKQYYIDLNDPYLVMNTNRLEPGQSDYLAMFSPPDFENLSSPQNYVNEHIGENNHPNGYMCMKPQIFSPRDTESEVFTFDIDGKPRDSQSAELSPMLHTLSESDTEGVPSPVVPNSFSNPSYHALPNLSELENEQIVQSPDNYVNMPKNKSAIMIKSKDNDLDIPYINSTTRDWERTQV